MLVVATAHFVHLSLVAAAVVLVLLVVTQHQLLLQVQVARVQIALRTTVL
jgi:hypothetical protein